MKSPANDTRRREETEFLPAALEIVETPPSPAGRAVILAIVLFFASAVAWASIGRIDIVAIAPGKITPSGRSRIIQSLVSGSIARIDVRDGQHVQAGYQLIALDATELQAQHQRLIHERFSNLAAISRIEALLGNLGSPDQAGAPGKAKAQLQFTPETPNEISQVESRLYASRWRQHLAGIKRYRAEIERKQAERRVIEENIEKQRTILPLVTERVQAVKQLSGKQFVAKADYLALEQERIERRQDLKALRHKRRETAAAITQAVEALANARAEFRSRLLQEQSERSARLNALTQELAMNSQQLSHMSIRAPVTGVVQQLAVNTLGGAVTTAQKLMIIVPESESMEVEAFIENRDIGFVNEGQPVELKVDAFPFTRYGTLNGHIRTLSRDAVAREDMGWAFAAHITLDQSGFEADGKTLPIVPGMSVQAEIKTGSRRLIEFLLSPVLKGLHDSARER